MKDKVQEGKNQHMGRAASWVDSSSLWNTVFTYIWRLGGSRLTVQFVKEGARETSVELCSGVDIQHISANSHNEKGMNNIMPSSCGSYQSRWDT